MSDATVTPTHINTLLTFISFIEASGPSSRPQPATADEFHILSTTRQTLRTESPDIVALLLDKIIAGALDQTVLGSGTVSYARLKKLLFGQFAALVGGDVVFPSGCGDEGNGLDRSAAGKRTFEGKRKGESMEEGEETVPMDAGELRDKRVIRKATTKRPRHAYEVTTRWNEEMASDIRA